MDEIKVSKFGGSSVANAAQIEKVRKIVESDSARRFVVVSAPGKDERDSEKVTDHLFNIATDGAHFKARQKKISVQESYDAVTSKFARIIQELAIDGDDIITDLEKDLQSGIEGRKRTDFFASRGEHYNAKIIARYFQKKEMNATLRLPEDVGFVLSDNFGNASVRPVSHKNLNSLLECEGIVIMPGYYGVTEGGDIAVLSRGGSDLTGGELAYSINASLYENWTDTDGIYQVDPKLIKGADIIPTLTYKEIRLLSSQGFNVFHYDAMVNCKKRNIPINIRNTNNPSAPGTMIVSERVPEETVVGIARLDDIAYLYLEADMMTERIGFTDDLLKIFREHGIMTYHYPTDKDDIAVLANQNDLRGKANIIEEDIMRILNPDVMEISYNLSILSPVGIGMKDCPGVLARAASSFGDEKINIEIVVQGPSQISFHFGVQGDHADNAMRAMYNAFFRKK